MSMDIINNEILTSNQPLEDWVKANRKALIEQKIFPNIKSKSWSAYAMQYSDSARFSLDSARFDLLLAFKNHVRTIRRRSKPQDIDPIIQKHADNVEAILLERRRKVMYAKSPKTRQTHVAVEIECTIAESRNRLAHLLAKKGLQYNVQVKTDGSINTRESGDCSYCSDGCQSCELSRDTDGTECDCDCTCDYNANTGMHANAAEIVVIGELLTFHDTLKRVCEVLNSDEVDAKVDKSCGLHVHLDMRFKPEARRETIFKRLVNAQPLLYSMVPRSRNDNAYCKPTDADVSFATAKRADRYVGVNASAMERHNTIEVRLHSGTTNFIKISNWVKLLHLIADATIEIKSIADLYTIGTPPELVYYIISRLKKFDCSGSWLRYAPDASAYTAIDTENSEVA